MIDEHCFERCKTSLQTETLEDLNNPAKHAELAAALRIRDKIGRLVALTPNAMQREYERRKRAKNIVLKARQLGMTTWIASRFFLHTITNSGVLTVQVAHDQQAAEEIFRIVHRFWANLPERLRTGALKPSRANVRQLVFPLLDSEYRVETAADPDAGRGLTIQNLHCSEVARWPRDAAETLASLRAAVAPHGQIVLESTPQGAHGCFYQEWRDAEETGYVRHFFPWWMEDGYRREIAPFEPTDEERELMRQHGLTLDQIAFRRDIRSNFRGLAKQEFAEDPESCFLASGDCVFEIEPIDERLAELASVESLKAYTEFLPSRTTKQYVIGVDPAGGGSAGDYCCAEVVDRFTGYQCAELHGKWPPKEFAVKLVELARHFNNALLAVEVNNHGGTVLAHLSYAGYDHVEEITTSSSTKSTLIAGLSAAISHAPESFHSVRLLREMRSFVRQKFGAGAAAAGAHDDCVMAMALALYARERTVGRTAKDVTWGYADLRL